MHTKIETLKASGAVAAGSVTGDAVKLQKVYQQATIILNVTAAATEVDDTLDVYLDTSYDGGTTWVNIAHFTQVLGNGGVKEFAVNIINKNPVAEIDVAADAAAGTIRALALGDRIRYRSVAVDAGGVAAAFTFGLVAFLNE